MEYVSIDSIKQYTANNIERIVADNASSQLIREPMQAKVMPENELENNKPAPNKIASQAIKSLAAENSEVAFFGFHNLTSSSRHRRLRA